MSDVSRERQVRMKILTERGWLEGTLRLPQAVRLVDWLNRAGAFLTLTDVHAGDHTIPYLSLRKSAVRIAAPTQAEDVSSNVTGGEPTPRTVWCMLANGSVRGTLDVLEHVRVSDFLAHHAGFVGLRDAHVHRVSPSGEHQNVEAVGAIVPLEAILGIAEEPPL
jgi:hypothetical protein